MFRRKPAAAKEGPAPTSIERPEIKELPQLELKLSGVGKLVHDQSGWRQTQPSGSAAGDASGLASENAKLREQLNLLTLKVDILVEMLALANLDVDLLNEQAKPGK